MKFEINNQSKKKTSRYDVKMNKLQTLIEATSHWSTRTNV